VCQPELAPLWRLDLAPSAERPSLIEPRGPSKSTSSIASSIFGEAAGEAGEAVGVLAGEGEAVDNGGVEFTATISARECQPALV